MCNFLDEVENGSNLSKGQKKYHSHTQKRDLAIVTLMLGTGMRVSECVGINKNDINFDSNAVKVTRKGGNEVILYFGEEVREALIDYIEERKNNPADTEDALFISMQGKRINVRTVQNLVKKYAKSSLQIKNISPHKLRTPTVRTYITKQAIYILLPTYWGMPTSTRQENIIPLRKSS